jgi:hypothetical protein
MIFSQRAVLGVLSLVALVLANGKATRTPTSRTGNRLVGPRLDQLTLSPNFKITDKPTTRTYDWTISMQEGAPDGFYRQMLVVNGMANIIFSVK